MSACSQGRRPAAPAAGAPPPDAPLPRTPRALAARLAVAIRELRAAAGDWRRQGTLRRGGPPDDVTLWALYEQRLYRRLAHRPRLARAVLARLPRRLAPAARDTVGALEFLFRLASRSPLRRRTPRTGAPAPAGRLLGWYREAQRRFRVHWSVLAAVNMVESAFGRFRSDSVAGAKGPMQFLPATWRRYGLGGDVHDPHDAILGAAHYLHASGAPRSYRRALYAYNASPLYVDAVLRLARRMTRDLRDYLGYYGWQVFVRTRPGERRITGPGLG